MTGKLVRQQRRESAERFGEVDEGTRARWTGATVRRVCVRHVVVGERLCEAVGVHAGERVLDVAAGSGNAALAAARRGASVTASDIAEAPLELALRRAELEGLALTTKLADARELPFEDASFDVILSTFGVMFAPDQERVADELTRLCQQGGRIGLASWTPRSLVGSSFATIDEHLVPAREVRLSSALKWGTVSHLQELLGDRVAELHTRRRFTDVCAYSAADLVRSLRATSDAINVSFAQLDQPRRARLAKDLVTDLERFNRAADGTFAARAEYLEAIAIRTSTHEA